MIPNGYIRKESVMMQNLKQFIAALEAKGELMLRDVEKRHIASVLEETGWRIEGPKGAAVILDINPSTLRTRMRKLGIKKP